MTMDDTIAQWTMRLSFSLAPRTARRPTGDQRAISDTQHFKMKIK